MKGFCSAALQSLGCHILAAKIIAEDVWCGNGPFRNRDKILI